MAQRLNGITCKKYQIFIPFTRYSFSRVCQLHFQPKIHYPFWTLFILFYIFFTRYPFYKLYFLNLIHLSLYPYFTLYQSYIVPFQPICVEKLTLVEVWTQVNTSEKINLVKLVRNLLIHPLTRYVNTTYLRKDGLS